MRPFIKWWKRLSLCFLKKTRASNVVGKFYDLSFCTSKFLCDIFLQKLHVNMLMTYAKRSGSNSGLQSLNFHVLQCGVRACVPERPRVFASVFGMQAWVTARCRLVQKRQHEWVPPPARSCQSDGEIATVRSEQSRVTNEGGHLCWKTGGLIDSGQRNGSGRPAENEINFSATSSDNGVTKDFKRFIVIINIQGVLNPTSLIILV